MTTRTRGPVAADLPRCLAAARRAAGIPSQAELARRVGLRRHQYGRMEAGARPNPAWEYVYRIIVGGGLGLEHFFPRDMIISACKRIAAADRNGDK
jgi:DNA-binding XRE family transcriptional regulator